MNFSKYFTEAHKSARKLTVVRKSGRCRGRCL